jgi:hypothetical protein
MFSRMLSGERQGMQLLGVACPFALVTTPERGIYALDNSETPSNTPERTIMNKVVLITGTSTGFGRTAAETLALRGYRVFATMRDCSGRNASTADALRTLADGEGWNWTVPIRLPKRDGSTGIH